LGGRDVDVALGLLVGREAQEAGAVGEQLDRAGRDLVLALLGGGRGGLLVTVASGVGAGVGLVLVAAAATATAAPAARTLRRVVVVVGGNGGNGGDGLVGDGVLPALTG